MHDRSEKPAGVGEPVDVRIKTRHMLGAIRKAFGMSSPEKTLPGRLIRKSPRVAVEIPFSYRAVKNNIVMPETFRGTIFDISYNGMMAELNQPLPDHSEIKLSLDTLLSYTKATDIDANEAEIYARITGTRPMNGRKVSGLEFICVSDRNKEVLMHCMLHIAYADNALLEEDLRRYEREAIKTTKAWRLTKLITIITLLAVSSVFFYLLSRLNEALNAVH